MKQFDANERMGWALFIAATIFAATIGCGLALRDNGLHALSLVVAIIGTVCGALVIWIGLAIDRRTLQAYTSYLAAQPIVELRSAALDLNLKVETRHQIIAYLQSHHDDAERRADGSTKDKIP
jgi:hypothetical protein